MSTSVQTYVFVKETQSAPAEPVTRRGESSPDGLILVLKPEQVQVVIPLGQEVLLGRHHASNQVQPEVDLTPYGAAESGMSRVHAAIRHDEHGWWLKDLNSSNGTWVDGERLAPHIPRRLHAVSQVFLAKLEFQVILPIDALPT
jgi:pSer/pThr/pTyr-binding forkhead associated (FHA) protein